MNYKVLITILTGCLFSSGTITAYGAGTPVETKYAGKYRLSKSALESYMGKEDADPKKFGTFTIELDQSHEIIIPDLLYPVDNNELGMRIIPVNDESPYGSKEMDRLLRQESYGQAKSNKDIFSLIVYLHPEKHKANFSGLDKALKTEMGMTHAGAYIGQGRTRNAPVDYHNRLWELFDDEEHGYPANVYTISLKDEDPEAVNKNLLIALRILNGHRGGPEYPINYKFDYFRTYNLFEVLSFYRAWLDDSYAREDINKSLGIALETPYIKLLKEHEGFKTYCNEHITIALNVGLNLVHTREGFQEVWGEKDGERLFNLAKDTYYAVTEREDREHAFEFDTFKGKKIKGEIIPEQLITKFKKPLWKRKFGELEHPLCTDNRINDIGENLVWRPQTTADIIADFIRVYADFTKVSAIRSTYAILNLSNAVYKRLGLSPDQYFDISTQFIQKMIEQEIRLLSARKPGLSTISQEERQKVADYYVTSLLTNFTPLLSGEMQLKEEAVKAQHDADALGPEISKLTEEVSNTVEKGALRIVKRKLETTYIKRKNLEATAATNRAKIQYIPKLKNLLRTIQKEGADLLKEPITVDFIRVNYRSVLENTPMGWPKNIEKMTVEQLAWVAFYADVNTPNIESADSKISLMDYGRSIRPKYDFTSQFKKKVKYVQYYSPPALVHKICRGLYGGGHPDVTFTAVATAFDRTEVVKK